MRKIKAAMPFVVQGISMKTHQVKRGASLCGAVVDMLE
jgi:hypothetical protein